MADDDAELVRRCLDGDPLGCRALVERFQRPVFGLCYRLLSHRQDAEDVAQEVFLRAFRSLHCWDGERSLKPWLLAIAVNRCRTAMRQRGRRPIPSAALVEAQPHNGRPDTSDLGEELQLALEGLREEYRTCFVLFHQQELSIAEVGELLGCPTGTVKTWLHRARRDLARHLQRRGIVPHAHYELHQI